MSTVPEQKSEPVTTPTSFSPGVNLPKSVLGITIKAKILVGCTRNGITIGISSIDTAVLRSQLEPSPVIMILRNFGSSPALSFRKAGAGSTDSTEHPVGGTVVVVDAGTVVVDAGTVVVDAGTVVVDAATVVVVDAATVVVVDAATVVVVDAATVVVVDAATVVVVDPGVVVVVEAGAQVGWHPRQVCF
jgi:hypothetical protein